MKRKTKKKKGKKTKTADKEDETKDGETENTGGSKDLGTEDNDDTVEDEDAEEGHKVEAVEDSVQETKNAEEADEVQEVKDDKSIEDVAPLASEAVEEPVKEPSEESKETANESVDISKTVAAEQSDVTKSVSEPTQEEIKEDVPQTGHSAEAEGSSSDLFGDSGPSFLETLQQAKSDDEITQLKQQNQKLTEENKALLEQLEELKNVNKSLKLTKMDNLDQLETLEHQVKDLESKLAKARIDGSGVSHSAYDNDDQFTLSPTPSYQQPQMATTFSQFNLEKQHESSLTLGELKARLNKWAGWNVDMSSWRSVGSGPVYDI